MRFLFHQESTDPDQWERYPSKCEKLEVEASDGSLLRDPLSDDEYR